MAKYLFSWIGQTDLDASRGKKEAGIGPISQALKEIVFDEVHLLCDYKKPEGESYSKWLEDQGNQRARLHFHKLVNPTDFEGIYQAARSTVEDVTGESESPDITFHISPGTSQMAAVWILLSKTRIPATIIQSSPKFGVQKVSVPFDISMDFIPELLRRSDEKLEKSAAGVPPETTEFSDIIHRSPQMQNLIMDAKQDALSAAPVLIMGESGTGKELLARAMHKASPRRDGKIIPVNCGAIPGELVESELFGHDRGAFTGATQARSGYFEDADGGTLFLDEIGELPLSAQVKLLRVLQQKEVTRLGSSNPKKIDVRIIAATNRNLLKEVQEGRFREDLFYRLAVLVLKIPPLREREGDLGLLIDGLWERINQENQNAPGYRKKKLSAGAKNILMNQIWPGNVRELENTLVRAVARSKHETIDEGKMKDNLLPSPPKGLNEDRISNRPIGESFNLNELLDSVTTHYLTRALEMTHGNKSKAAKLLGFKNHQTFMNWMKRYSK